MKCQCLHCTTWPLVAVAAVQATFMLTGSMHFQSLALMTRQRMVMLSPLLPATATVQQLYGSRGSASTAMTLWPVAITKHLDRGSCSLSDSRVTCMNDGAPVIERLNEPARPFRWLVLLVEVEVEVVAVSSPTEGRFGWCGGCDCCCCWAIEFAMAAAATATWPALPPSLPCRKLALICRTGAAVLREEDIVDEFCCCCNNQVYQTAEVKTIWTTRDNSAKNRKASTNQSSKRMRLILHASNKFEQLKRLE